MTELTSDVVLEIERIHGAWLQCEVVGEVQGVLDLCANSIQLWPSDGEPLQGRTALAAMLTREAMVIHDIEISERRIRGTNELAYLTANFCTTFSLKEESICRQARGSHLWILEKHLDRWLVVLLCWTSWSSENTSVACS